MISRLYHPSHITSVAAVAANPEVLCPQNVLDEWTALWKISKREHQELCHWLEDKESIWVVRLRGLVVKLVD